MLEEFKTSRGWLNIIRSDHLGDNKLIFFFFSSCTERKRDPCLACILSTPSAGELEQRDN